MNEEDNMSTVESISRIRLVQIVSRITEHTAEAVTFFKEGSDDKTELQKAQICASKLENMIKRFNTELNEYFRISNNPSADEIFEMSNKQLNGEEALAELRCLLSIKLGKEKAETQNKGDQSRTFSAKLPTLTLPEFSGDVLTWCEYWDIYKSNIHDRPISDVDKLLYLKSTLKVEPRRIIDGLETTNKNYEVAIEMLTNRYGKQSRIIDAHYSALSKVKAAATSIVECRTTLNEVERHLRVLQSLGENTNHNHLRYLITEKFPPDIVYEMKMKMKDDTVEEMRIHLESIISAREEANRIRQEKNTTTEDKPNYTVETLHIAHNDKKQNNYNTTRKYNDFRKGSNTTKGSYYVRKDENRNSKQNEEPSPSCSEISYNSSRKRKYEANENTPKVEKRQTKEYTDNKRRKLSCIFCNEDHFPDQCQECKTIEERKAKLKNRCFNCFSEKHMIRFCENKRECAYCHKTGSHHRALCPEKTPSTLD